MPHLKGHLLIAGVQMLDPNFAQTVTLLVEHNADGAMGLVLNRATNLTVGAAWAKVSDQPCLHEGYLHQGGPCPGPLMILHDDPDHSMIEVSPGIHFTAEESHVTALLAQPPAQLRCFVNYAGWASDQLERELEEETWILAPATAATVFAAASQASRHWLNLLRRISPSQVAALTRPQLWPKDPNMN